LNILHGNSANFNDLSVPDYSPDILANFKYVQIISVDVEHSFSTSTFLQIAVIISQKLTWNIHWLLIVFLIKILY